MLRTLARYCAYREGTAVSEAEVRATIAPQSLTGSDPAESGSAWRDSLELALEFELLARGDDQLTASAELRGLAAEDRPSFRRGLRQVVLAATHNAGLWDAGSNGRWSSAHSREFSRIAAWYLEQSPHELLNSDENAYALARREVDRESEKLVENQEQWNVFCRWAAALGLAAVVGGAYLPDAAVAVEDELVEMCQAGETQ